MTICGIETSPSGRAKCVGCGRVIGKGTPRGKKEISQQNYGSSYSYLCYSCSLKKIDNNIKYLKNMKKELNIQIKQKSKEIVLMGLK